MAGGRRAVPPWEELDERLAARWRVGWDGGLPAGGRGLGGGAAHGGGEGGGKKQRPAISGITGRHWFRLAGGEGLTPLVLHRAASASGWAVTAPACINVGLGQPHVSPQQRYDQTGRTALRTAHRGARSVWTRHATGLAGPDTVITWIAERLP